MRCLSGTDDEIFFYAFAQVSARSRGGREGRGEEREGKGWREEGTREVEERENQGGRRGRERGKRDMLWCKERGGTWSDGG